MAELYILCWDIQISTQKHSSVLKSNFKDTEPYIFSGDIQIPTEKHSLVLK